MKKSYTLEVIGNGTTRDVKPVGQYYPCPSLIDATILASDHSVIPSAGFFYRQVMKQNGIKQITFDWRKRIVRVTAISNNAWIDIEFVKSLVIALIDSHFEAAAKE